jgi:hypothetical protein
MQTIAINSLLEYPLLQVQAASVATIRQLISVHTGEGVVDHVWHTYRIIEQYAPQLATDMRAARQQHGELSFANINRLQYPVALAALALLPVIFLLAYRRKLPDVSELVATCGLALLANAFICGTLSNPHDRYGARLVWIAVLALVIAFMRFTSSLGSRGDIA